MVEAERAVKEELSKAEDNRNRKKNLDLYFYLGLLTDTGEDSKLVRRRKRPKVDTLFSSVFSDVSQRLV